VKVKDIRQYKATLGDAGDSIGTNPIVTGDDIDAVLRSGVESELRNRGFQLGAGNALVMIELEAVAVRDRTPLAALYIANNARAMVIIGAQVKPANGPVLYSKIIDGKAAFGARATETYSSISERALDYALDDTVRNLAGDPKFIEALLATRKPAPLAAPANKTSPASH
ncbi:MAG: YajG family lipoprotein, partial [Candidatus Binataceae bacterium]